MANVDEKTNELATESGKNEKTPKPTKRTSNKTNTSKKTSSKAAVTDAPSFKTKLLTLQANMAVAAEKVEFDKAITNIKHEYADTQQYKKWLSSACSSLGLIFKLDVTCSFPEEIGIQNGKPLFGSMATGLITITDTTSDQFDTYDICGFGSNFQPGYCVGVAQTNALRLFILNNYLLDNLGRDGDDENMNSGQTVNANGYVPPSAKADIKASITNNKNGANHATDIFASALYEKIMLAQEIEPEFGAKMVATHFNEDGSPKLGADGKSTMTKSSAVAGMTKAEEIIEKGAK